MLQWARQLASNSITPKPKPVNSPTTLAWIKSAEPGIIIDPKETLIFSLEDFLPLSIDYIQALENALLQLDENFVKPPHGSRWEGLNEYLTRIHDLNTRHNIFSAEDFELGLAIYWKFATSDAELLMKLSASYSQEYVFITSLMIGHKFLQDVAFDNRTWSGLMNLSAPMLKALEQNILVAINFSIPIDKLQMVEENGKKKCRYV